MNGTGVYSFRGGPWDGYVIEYPERATPDGVVDPAHAQPRAAGLYHLDDRANIYLWNDRAGREA